MQIYTIKNQKTKTVKNPQKSKKPENGLKSRKNAKISRKFSSSKIFPRFAFIFIFALLVCRFSIFSQKNYHRVFLCFQQIGSRPPPAAPVGKPPTPPPPTLITLRATPPIRQVFFPPNFKKPKKKSNLVYQEPAPVFESQPAAIHDQGGVRMRGDEKWPPAPVKQQAEVENAERIAVARGPAMRPRRVKRDYSTFFAQNALNSSYPGYRAPPGTQHYIEDGTSQL